MASAEMGELHDAVVFPPRPGLKAERMRARQRLAWFMRLTPRDAPVELLLAVASSIDHIAFGSFYSRSEGGLLETGEAMQAAALDRIAGRGLPRPTVTDNRVAVLPISERRFPANHSGAMIWTSGVPRDKLPGRWVVEFRLLSGALPPARRLVEQ